MKKLITIMIFVVLAIGTAIAQNNKTITGYVVDKNGNPLSGAEVMAVGGGASTITDADGSFTLDVHILLKKITASYPGMEDNTVSLKNQSDFVITMSPKIKKTGFISFIGVGGLVNEEYSFYHPGYGWYEDNIDYGLYGIGIMGGQLGKWGWYVKGLYHSMDSFNYNGGTLTAGAIKSIGRLPIYLYLGAGVASHEIYYSDSYIGYALDFGAIFKINRHLNIIGGINWGDSRCDDAYDSHAKGFNLNIGVGYVF